MSALERYEQHGIAFDYPAGWELIEEAAGPQRTITLQTPGASFWTLTAFDDRLEPDHMLESVVQAFRDDYEDLDVYPVQATVLDAPAAATDLDFVYLDLVNSVAIRAFQTDERSALVMYQGTDQELEVFRERFEAVTASLTFAE